MSAVPPPKHLDLDKKKGLTVTWHDDRTSFYAIDYLRRMSPSADQRELREQMKRNPLTVLPSSSASSDAPLHATGAEMVGNYAIRIVFSDGHDTGIFSWEYLREIDPETSSAGRRHSPADLGHFLSCGVLPSGGTMYTERERILRTLRFEPVDRLPFRFAYGLMPGVLEAWHEQGLPDDVRSRDDVHRYFGFPVKSPSLPLDLGFHPAFDARVLEEDDERRVEIDHMGRRTLVLKRFSTLPRALEYPVRDRATWADFRRRLAFFPERVGADLERVAEANRAAGHLNMFGTSGFFWFPRDLMGDENLCLAYYDDPDLVHDMLETWCGLIERVLEAALRRERLDAVHFGEDMAYRHASLIGPDTFEQFMKPYYLRIRRLVDRYEVPIFSVDTDGALDQLIEWFLPCGVNLIGPDEVQAGNDIVAFRRRFGRRMAFDGGLDKRVLRDGRVAIDAMLERTIPPMKASGGGWIVCLDHRVLDGTRLDDFRYFVDRTREMISDEGT